MSATGRYRLLFVSCLALCSCRSSALPFQEYGVVSVDQPFKFVGDTLELYCNITNKSVRENSSMLYFSRTTSHGNSSRFNGHTYTSSGGGISTNNDSVIPQEYIEILTTKAIRLRLRNLTIEDGGTYVCAQTTFSGEPRVIEHKIIEVDFKPKRVEAVKCRVYNWESMKCTWDLGVDFQHKENINVTVAWTIHGTQQDCPLLTKTSCTWDKDHYHHGHQYYMVVVVQTVDGKKVLAEKNSPQFHIETQLYVEPAPVMNLQATVNSSTSIQLSWRHSSSRKKFFVGGFRIQDEKNWTAMFLNDIDGEDQNCESLVTDLRPHTSYEFRIAVLPFPTEALRSQGHRSKWQYVEAQTLEDIPTTAPKICPGCFHQQPCIDGKLGTCVRIYWQDLDDQQKNGILKSYNVTYSTSDPETRHSMILPISSEQSLTMADLRLPTSTHSYEVSLTPATSKGSARKSSIVIIPEEQIRPQPPQSFLVERDENVARGDLKFYLSWAAVERDPRTKKNYDRITVTWCLGVRLEYKCEGDINWIDLPAEQVTYELKPDVSAHPSQFLIGISGGISYNKIKYSSGIEWSSCVYLNNLKPQNSPKNVHQSKQHPVEGLTILWDKFECAEEKSFITEYLVKYCPLDVRKKCLESEKSQNVSNGVREVTLDHLKAGKMYSVTVIAVSAAGLGPNSTIVTEAVEGAPPEPDSSQNVGIAIGISVAAMILLIIIFCCCRYCARRHKKADDLIQPYAQTQALPHKKTQDFRNRPLPKTPEDQHIYGSSACMNSPGSDKNKDNRNSESSSEDSVNSHTRLLSGPTTNTQVSPASKDKQHNQGEPYLALKDFGYGGSTDKSGSAKEMERLLEPQLLAATGENKHTGNNLLQMGGVGLPYCCPALNVGHSARALPGTKHDPDPVAKSAVSSSGSIAEYQIMGLNEGDNVSSYGAKVDRNDASDRTLNKSNMDTLPIRPHPGQRYPAPGATGHTVYPVLSSVMAGTGQVNGHTGDLQKSTYVGSCQPSTKTNMELLPSGYGPNITSEVTNRNLEIPVVLDSTGASDRSQNVLQHSPVWRLRDSRQDMPDVTDQTKFPFNKRKSVPLESVLHFPPPPSSPPPSPCPEDLQRMRDLSLPQNSQTSNESTGFLVTSASAASIQPPANSASVYVPHGAAATTHPNYIPQPTHNARFSDNVDRPDGPIPAISVDYLPHNSPFTHSMIAQPPSHLSDSYSDVSGATIPRSAGQTQSTLPLPSPLSRPLSGDLLDLPLEYYKDPKLDGSNLILTEL